MPDETITYLWAPINKSDSSSRMISGPISGPNNVDSDGHIVDVDWLRRAIGPYLTFGNIRQQHDRNKPIGKAIAADMTTADGVPVITAKIVDDAAWKLVSEGVLSGFSIGIKNPTIVKDASAPRGRIVGGQLTEISCVDHPSNANARYSICKSVDGSQGWLDSQSGMFITSDDLEKGAGETGINPTLEMHDHGELKHAHAYNSAEHQHCPDCGTDPTVCTCQVAQAGMVNKAVDAFEQFTRTPLITPSKTGPDVSGESDLDPEGPAQSGSFNIDVIMKKIRGVIEGMADKVDSKNEGGFSPNLLSSTKADGPAGRAIESVESTAGNTFAPGYPGAESQQWDGVQSSNAPGAKAATSDDLTADMVLKIATAAAEGVILKLLDGGLLTKAATSDSTKASFSDALQVAFSDATKELEDRLAKVEKMAAPSKGIANALPLAIEKDFVLNTAERQVVENQISKSVSSLSDSDQMNLLTKFLTDHTYANR